MAHPSDQLVAQELFQELGRLSFYFQQLEAVVKQLISRCFLDGCSVCGSRDQSVVEKLTPSIFNGFRPLPDDVNSFPGEEYHRLQIALPDAQPRRPLLLDRQADRAALDHQ
jgi:hypothetical protein